MILVGQYDSPYVRRVAVSLRVLAMPYEHDTRSVFADFDSMRRTNPLGRIPSLVLDDGQVLIDSAAILDWLDEMVGPARALTPRSGPARRRALKRIALATGGIDKLGQANYERFLRPEPLRWPDWIARCVAQTTGALEALDADAWDDTLDQAAITTGCLLGYIELSAPEVMPAGRFPVLERLWARLGARPEFVATRTASYGLPPGRLRG